MNAAELAEEAAAVPVTFNEVRPARPSERGLGVSYAIYRDVVTRPLARCQL